MCGHFLKNIHIMTTTQFFQPAFYPANLQQILWISMVVTMYSKQYHV